jgi:hypothetical protein
MQTHALTTDSTQSGVSIKVHVYYIATTSDVRWKIFQNIFRFLKSSLNIYFFNLFLVALGVNEIAVTVDIAEYRNKEKLWSRDVIWRAAVSVSGLSLSPDPESSDSDIDFVC